MALEADYYTVAATGVSVTTSGVTARVALPVNAAGLPAKYVRIQAVSAPASFRLGDVTVTATTNDFVVSPNESVTVSAYGYAYIAYISQGSATSLNVTPLEA
jgi:hypothetical protein